MFTTREAVVEAVGAAVGGGEDLWTLTERALADLGEPGDLGGVIAATFSNGSRFPSLAVRAAALLKLPAGVPAFDLQMACSSYPYAVYLAGRLAADTGRRILVINGDVQSRLVDASDHATGSIFSDAVTVSIVSSAADGALSSWDFLSRYDEALVCPSEGPIRMDGMKVFTFVATEVSALLRNFLPVSPDLLFIPHQANPYMVRQLAKSLGLSDRLLTLPEEMKNPGGCSIPLTIRENGGKLFSRPVRALIAGFGAGYSASAGIVRIGL